MLKIVVFLSFCVTFFASALVVRSGRNEALSDDWMLKEIRKYDYPAEHHVVQTSDGYILDLIRIPSGAQQQGGSRERGEDKDISQPSEQIERLIQTSNQWPIENREQPGQENTKRPAVLLIHGVLCSADSFIMGGPQQGLAYMLADNGYDVFLGNTRGSKYGLKHTTLNPQSDAAFWKFSSDEIGMKDMPAIVDTVIRVAGQQKIHVIGHMQGNTALYIMASEWPQYNDKIQSMISLSPVAYLGHSSSKMLTYINQHIFSKGWIIKNVGQNSFRPSEDLLKNSGKADCEQSATDNKICNNPYFLLNGYKSQIFNKTVINEAIQRHGGSASSWQVLHFAQLARTGSFAKYNQEQNSDQESSENKYDLQKVSVPVYLLYASHDNWSNPEDVEKLASRLPRAYKLQFQNLENSLDFLYATNVRQRVHEKIVEILKSN